jgi:AraC-like DNA-binding protein
MPKPNPLLSRWTSSVLDAEVGTGPRRSAFLGSLELSPSDLEEADTCMDYRTMCRIWDRLGERSGCALGLRIAERSSPEAFGLLTFLARSSATLGDALHRVARFHRLIMDESRVELTARGNLASLVKHPPLSGPPLPRPLVEACLGSYLVWARRWSGVSLVPVEVRFQHEEPASVDEHARIFGCRVVFGHRHNELVMPRAALALPLPSSEPLLCSYLEHLASDQLEQLPAPGDFVERVRRAITRALPGGSPKIEQTARTLSLGVRTLQRRLKDHGIVYNDLVDTIRRDAAVTLLTRGGSSVGEIALLLGFSDTSGFRRAFRRWTGSSPRRQGPSAPARRVWSANAA